MTRRIVGGQRDQPMGMPSPSSAPDTAKPVPAHSRAPELTVACSLRSSLENRHTRIGTAKRASVSAPPIQYSHEIVFADTATADYPIFVEPMRKATVRQGSKLKFIPFEAGHDGVRKISDTLAQKSNLLQATEYGLDLDEEGRRRIEVMPNSVRITDVALSAGAVTHGQRRQTGRVTKS